MGQGDGMIGANIFVIYSDPTGQNVTLSPRLGVAYKMPKYNPHAEVSLLEGSGITNGTMTANFKCKLDTRADVCASGRSYCRRFELQQMARR